MSKKENYTIFPSFIVRTPLFPVTYLQKEEMTDSSVFREGLFLASPTLYRNFEENRAGKKEELDIAIQKYFSRTCTRSTPFGLFAGCSIGKTGESTRFTFPETDKYKRCTRLDMLYLCALIQKTERDKTLREQLRYYPNDSLYEIAEKFRYVEYHYKGVRKIHQVSSVDKTEYLEQILKLAKKGEKISVLGQALVDEDISLEDASLYINELIDAQILKSEIDPSVVGEDVLTGLIKKLSKLENIPFLQTLIDIRNALQEIDEKPLGTTIGEYASIIERVKSLGIPFEEKFLFQVDMVKPTLEATVSESISGEIKKALYNLKKLNLSYNPKELDAFKKAFRKRFEEQEIPLAIALDNELGIGYPANTPIKDPSFLLDNLSFPEKPRDKNNGSHDHFDILLLKKYIEAEQKGERIIFLKDKDFGYPSKETMPEICGVMCKIVQDDTSGQLVHMISASNTMGGNFLGRFSHLGPEYMQTLRDLATYEQQKNPDKIIAELSHLPESRLGNVTSRLPFRDHILHYLSNTDERQETDISISDLMISVKNNRIVLRSKKFNKEVIPSLTCAHNFSRSKIPAYYFLADLQYQNNLHILNFKWGRLFSHFDHLPRIQTGNIILNRESWNIQKKEHEKWSGLSEEELLETIRKFREEKNIPRFITVSEFDNEMCIDLEHKTSIKSLLSITKKKDSFVMEEFLFHPNSPFRDTAGNPFSNEAILIYHK